MIVFSNPKEMSTSALNPEILALIRRALAEDVRDGDITSNRIVPSDARLRGRILAKDTGVVAGLDVAGAVFLECDENVEFAATAGEGSRVEKDQTLASVSGLARALLTAERTALNFLGRMSGIASLTRRFVDAVAGTHAVILDTRKTAPGLRLVDKLAVRRGGGMNHRMGLYDMVLIKDNHIDFAGGLEPAVQSVRSSHPAAEIEVEARTLAEVRLALELGVKRILLDNMKVEEMAQAVSLTHGAAKLEASGNVKLENIRRIAETGVDYISIGALTHSAPVLDVSFDILR
jgi:nicotinate-nucleotide pyrophosphorylase (carboxylating)